ncbi:MAG: prepilin-type N-terminal cleavage/methylation domain-containing protein [Planctomycetes bacterium]|nr:prepilin-type N-terminal cleavage/methylation domain-containing protein [Planctomycetota bacterium]
MRSRHSETRLYAGRRHSGARAGFTILEILIAVAILVIGLLGILALFPVAIYSGNRSVADTCAVIITESVEQAIREGLQHRKGQSQNGDWTYFLFQHDGVLDPLPPKITSASPGADNYILLPSEKERESLSSDPRKAAYDRGKVFVYPETDGRNWEIEVGGGTQAFDDTSAGAPPNGQGSVDKADDDRDEFFEIGVGLSEEDAKAALMPANVKVMRTYQLTNGFLRGDAELETLPEEEQRALRNLQNYSFAFAIRRAFNDGSLGIQHFPETLGRTPTKTNQIVPANELYEVTIMIFRGFLPGTTTSRPVYSTTILVHR